MASQRRLSPIAGLAALALALSACGNAGGGGAQSGTGGQEAPPAEGVETGPHGGESLAVSEPTEGGELTWAVWMPINSLDPAGSMGDSILLAMASVYGTLTKAMPDGTVEPHLAESLETEDNVTWTLELDPELTFTDGTPFDAEAVITHLENVRRDGSTSTQARDARIIKSMEAVDDFTVEFTLEEANNQFDLMFTDGSMGMIPSPTAKEKSGADFATQPVGAGPFKVEQFRPGREIVLVKNEDYKFADDSRPYLDQLTLRTVSEQSSRVDGVLAGDLDGGTVASVPALNDARESGAIGLEQPVMSAYYLKLNNEYGPFSDVRVRKAISHAIDREAINQVVYEGTHQPMTGVVVPAHPQADQDGDWPTEFDVEQAKQLLDEYKQEEGVDNLSMTITIVPGGESAEITPLIQQMLGQIGITVNIETVDQTSLVGKIAQGEHQATLLTRTLQGETTTALRQYFHSESSRNWTKTSVPEVDTLLEESASAATDEERLAAVPEILELLAEDVATIPIVSSGAGRILGPDVAGFPDGDVTSRTIERFDPTEVWMKD